MSPIFLDLRGMHPPEPMEHVLEALDRLEPGQQLQLLMDREPFPLYRILANNGFRHLTMPRPDFLFDVMIVHG
ncbi:MAG: DUF2249 domain-containing protein [Telluria sp.]|jgi:uncharacterized protein (DUF2249 family)